MSQITDVFTAIAFVGTFGLAVGCGSQSGPGTWAFDDAPGASGTANPSSDDGSSADAGPPSRGSDGPSDDAGLPPDARSGPGAGDAGTVPEVGSDAGTSDGGPRTIDDGGWYVAGFERSEFIPQSEVYMEGNYRDGECSTRLHNPLLQRERWWARWRPDPEPGQMRLFSRHFADDPGPSRVQRAGYYEVRGRLSGEGEYGHLGDYDRRFTVTEAELDVCRSVSRLGHCAVPRIDGANCAILDDRELGRESGESLQQDRFVRKYLKGDSGAVRYALRVKSDAVDSWSFRLSFTSESGPVEASSLQVGDLTAPELSARTGWTPRREYTDLEGWVGRVPQTKRETLHVSISGRLPEQDSSSDDSHPSRVHVWGAYTVEERRDSR